MFRVEAQLNNGNPCPKREHRAWNWEEKHFESLEDAIEFLIEKQAAGFIISECNDDDIGLVVASRVTTHYGD